MNGAHPRSRTKTRWSVRATAQVVFSPGARALRTIATTYTWSAGLASHGADYRRQHRDRGPRRCCRDDPAPYASRLTPAARPGSDTRHLGIRRTGHEDAQADP